MFQYECKYEYKLPQSFIDSILLLQSVVNIPLNSDDTNYKKGPKSHKQLENMWSKDNNVSRTILEDGKPVAKLKKKTGTEKDIEDIRMALNLISTRNYESQRNVVIEHVKSSDAEVSLKVAQFIFDIASSNKFYVELYVDLYTELISESSVFEDILNDRLSVFVNTINDMKHIDPNDDYDNYCRYVSENDKRRALVTFYMHLSKKQIIDSEKIFSIIILFQSIFLEFIEKDDKVAECDEIAEIISIFVSIGKKSPCFVSNKKWGEIISNVVTVSKFKAKSYKSLSNRTVFKYLDIVDSI